MKISLAMIVKNEEKYIKECLNNAKDLVDEIVVVDTGSTDNTVKIAEELGAIVYNFKWVKDFSAARNFAIEKCIGDWILVLDADEIVNQGSKSELIEFANKNINTIGKIERQSKFKSSEGISYSKEYISRFFPKGVKYVGKIHEQLDGDFPRKDVGISVKHYGYYEVDKSERNLELLYEELRREPNDSYILYQIARTLYVAKRYEEADEYFKKCYKINDINTSYWKNFIVFYLYNLIKTREFERGLEIINLYDKYYYTDADFNFVSGIFYMELVLFDINTYVKYFGRIEQAYLKCLSIGENANNTVVGVGSFRAAHNLGAFYEVSGNIGLALEYYNIAAQDKFEPSINRINVLINN